MFLRLIFSFFCLAPFFSMMAATNLGDAFFAGTSTAADGRSNAPHKDRVIVVANSNDAESLSLARYYCEKRSIPFANVISLPLSKEESISREEFTSTLYNPLLRELIARSWINAATTEEKDPEGRLTPNIMSHKIDFMVLMRGVPLKINRDTFLLEMDPNKPSKKEFQVNEASVDSELACMPMGRYPLTAFVPNPLFNKKNPSPADVQKIIRVTRLDGMRSDHVISMIDSAIKGERDGLRGRAYFDMGGPHKRGDELIEQVVKIFETQGFGMTVDNDKALLSTKDRWDAPAIYLGWYAFAPQGPFLLRDFTFAPGAIAWHIHSFSAKSFRALNQGWMSIIAQKGAAATLGNVFEPYLELTHIPNVYFMSLLDGVTHGEAAYASIPVLSWMNVAVGDPLYRPFSIALSTQLERARNWQDRSPYAQYTVIRVMNLLKDRGKTEEAILLGRQSFRKNQGLALALELIQQIWAKNPQEADEYISVFEKITAFTGDNLPVAIAAAAFLSDGRNPAAAVDIYQKIILSPATARDVLKTLLPDAIAAAKAAQRPQETAIWEQKLQEITPPPPPPPAKTPTTNTTP